MIRSGSVFSVALPMVRRALKARGLSAKRVTFFRKADNGNTMALLLQRSVKSSPGDTLVTINYGVYSARLGARLQEDPAFAIDVTRAHWRKRLAEGGREKWLHLKATDSAEGNAGKILEIVHDVLSELVDHSTDESLIREWSSGSSPGIVNMQRLLFLAILMNEVGARDTLADVVNELRRLVGGTIHEALIKAQLASAEVKVQW